MQKIIKSSSSHESNEQLTGAWHTRNGGRCLQISITKSTPITEFEFDHMIEIIAEDLRKAYLMQRFRPRKKKILE